MQFTGILFIYSDISLEEHLAFVYFYFIKFAYPQKVLLINSWILFLFLPAGKYWKKKKKSTKRKTTPHGSYQEWLAVFSLGVVNIGNNISGEENKMKDREMCHHF